MLWEIYWKKKNHSFNKSVCNSSDIIKMLSILNMNVITLSFNTIKIIQKYQAQLEKSQVLPVLDIFDNWISRFSNFSVFQKLTLLSASKLQIMTEVSLRVVYIFLLGNKFKSYIKHSSKCGYVTVLYLGSSCKKKVSWILMVSYFMKN